MMTCHVLDSLGQQYGKTPAELLAMDAAELSFAVTVMREANAYREGMK